MKELELQGLACFVAPAKINRFQPPIEQRFPPFPSFSENFLFFAGNSVENLPYLC